MNLNVGLSVHHVLVHTMVNLFLLGLLSILISGVKNTLKTSTKINTGLRGVGRHFVSIVSTDILIRCALSIILEYDVVSVYHNRNGVGGHTYMVYLDDKNLPESCSCGIFQHPKIFCSHAYAVCNKMNFNPFEYVHVMFRLSTITQIYGTSFCPIDGLED